MNTSFIKRTILLVLAIISICSLLPVSAGAAYSSMQCNISKSPATCNLTNGPLPPASGDYSAGETANINLAATTDFYLKTFSLYVKTPNQASFSTTHSYRANGYYRWYTVPYTFSSGAGTYTFRLVITTTSGTEYNGEFSVDVKGGNNGGGTNYNYNGTQYRVVSNFRSEFWYNQNNYSRFVNSRGNRGCTATAMCSAYAMRALFSRRSSSKTTRTKRTHTRPCSARNAPGLP